MNLILAIYIVSLALILSEAFVPGFLVGILGLAGVSWAIVEAWRTQGWTFGMGMLFIAVAIVPAVLLRAIRKLTLNTRIDAPTPPNPNLNPGQEGVAETPLLPGGIALFNGNRTDVLTRGEPVDRGCPIRIVAVDGSRVVVASAERRLS